jgi:hypothetical protein
VLPSYLQTPTSQYYGKVSEMLAGDGPQRINYAQTAAQQQALARARGLLDEPESADRSAASGALRSLLDFAPATVTAGQLRDTDLTAYTNPYENEVVQRTIADIDKMRSAALANNQGAATRAGAYGGSRHGVIDALTNEAALKTSGDVAASLRQAGHSRAQDLALIDIANRLGANQFNAQQGAAGAALRAGAAGQLMQGDAARQDQQRAAISLLAALGDNERAARIEGDLANDPARMQADWVRRLQELLGINPAILVGSSGTEQSSSKSTTTKSASLLDALAQAIKIYASSGVPMPGGGAKGAG